MPEAKDRVIEMPPDMDGLSLESATRVFEERFGDSKPIPSGVFRMPPFVHEACRLFIHEAKSLDAIKKILDLDEPQMKKIYYSKRVHKWAPFMGILSAALRPSQLLSIEPHNLSRVKRERDRRARLLPGYEDEEMRLLGMLKVHDPGSKSYKEITASLEKIRDTIATYTNIKSYEEEQSMARRELMKKQIERMGRTKDGDDDGRSADLLTLDLG